MPCDAPPTHIDWNDALDPGHVLILGEMHGTNEIPKSTSAVSCDALRAGRSVGLFVEWPTALQARLAAPVALLADAFFSGAYQDGRRSSAMVGLVADAESWALSGAPIDVRLFDPGDGDRDAGMAAAVHSWTQSHPSSVAVVLVGNVHARLSSGWRENTTYQPLGFRLLDLGARLRSLDVRYSDGSAWNCQPDCGVHALHGDDRGAIPKVEWASARTAYDGWYYVGVPTPSRPATETRPP